MPNIRVHEKVLAHLSRGLYRSPASAIRELVSNAWDANATSVRINTGYPKFFQLSVEDNGDGFTRQEFQDLMEGGIGNSLKRTTHKPPINGRPQIGRLGIGMLGIAQLCGAFTVVSKTRSGEGFKARVKLYDLLKERLDREDKEVIRTKQSAVSGEAFKEVDIGQYEFEKFDLKNARRGTIIFADDLHPVFIQAFQASLEFEKYRKPSFDWTRNIERCTKVHSLQELGDYWRLLWELAASCPLPYVSANALPDDIVREDQKHLLSFNFEVLVDGIKLFKPVKLSGNPGGYTTRRIEHRKLEIYGRTLEFHGYIAVQEGAQLRPDELRGILIRIKNVGIGLYDPSFLDYRFNEGPRAKWLTGEIVADQGLENALNIDRDSFNRFHPEFKAIQAFVHRLLNKEVFPETYKKIEKRTQKRAAKRGHERQKHLRSVVSSVTSVPVSIAISKGLDESTSNVQIREGKKRLEITLPNAETLKTKKSNRDLANAALAIFEIALQEKTKSKARERFKKLLLALLAQW